MPPVLAGIKVIISPRARLSYLTLFSIRRAAISISARGRYASSSGRSDFDGQPFTGSYDIGGPTRGPLGEAAAPGPVEYTPTQLKSYLDLFVVGQERAKKMICTHCYAHHQRVRELQRLDDEEQEKRERENLKIRRRHREAMEAEDGIVNGTRVVGVLPDLEDEPPSTFTTINKDRPHSNLMDDLPPVTIEKSNLMVIGPTGVGKTLIIKSLARRLGVPFSMSVCTSLTQAGYIGEDVDMIIQRLFIAADCDPVRTEYGIVCLDEVDKLQVRRGTNGRDVGGEGVQQALLKILEGTTVTVTAKSEPRNNQRNATSFVGGFGGNGAISGSSSAGKPETYQIRTDNILFICTGAFVGLQKIILDRISKGSIGFGAPVRALSSDSQATLSSAERSLYFKNLPFYSEVSATSANDEKDQDEEGYNPLDLVEPNDLQKYGLIPEFLGRIPTITALAPLSVASLARVLTEPRNSIIAQYTHLFHLFNVELRFTSLAIQEIAKSAHKLGTGARGVRTAVDRLLGESMYYSPGSSVRYVLVTGKAARREEGLGYWARGQATKFHAAIAAEEEEWEAIQSKQTKKEDSEVASFEEFREKAESGM